ncbi:TadE family type IV pilus minor pilin [Nocardioides dubius]|uniref:TadE-like domain-containing protein n=1 Tax=Nocardioides dubius TaxID=317019 RepID=A0ABP4EI72_9ACTN
MLRRGRRRWCARAAGHDEGAVTAELVMALPVLVLVTIAMVWFIGFGVGQVRSTDAAREAARALARGESEAVARELVQQVDPGAEVRISRTGDRVTVVVQRARDGPIGVFGALGGRTRGEAVAAVEEVPP